MSDGEQIPAEWHERSPLLTTTGWALLQRIRQQADAPRWNFETGDRLLDGDLAQVDTFRAALTRRDDVASATDDVPGWLCDAVMALRARSWFVERQVPVGFDLRRDWVHLPTMSRDDLASRIAQVVPHDIEDFSRLLVYDTSGTSGHAVHVPHDPLVLAKSQALAERAMRRHGASPTFGSDEVACLNLCAQSHTYVFASIFNVWNGAGFVKANLHERDWAGGRAAARRYLGGLGAGLVTSDPISLSEAMRWDVELRPRAIISTAVGLSAQLRTRFAAHFGCPVIDWYSLTETGPIACSAPDGDGWEIVPHDVFVEVIDEVGLPVPEGVVGEICVTTLRNPMMPLVRYRTGDYASIERGAVPRLRDLDGRAPVFFRSADGNPVSSVDIGRAMRLVSTFAQHAFAQRADGSCTVTLRPVPGLPIDERAVRSALSELLGLQPLEIAVDESLGTESKIPAYASEIEL